MLQRSGNNRWSRRNYKYWQLQFTESPAGGLEGLQAEGDEVVVSYAVPASSGRQL